MAQMVGVELFQHTAARRRLAAATKFRVRYYKFQHTAARRRLGFFAAGKKNPRVVSTHSRPKAAGAIKLIPHGQVAIVSTHSRPKAAGTNIDKLKQRFPVSTHSRPKAAGAHMHHKIVDVLLFQHTAARRRLDLLINQKKCIV